MARAARTLAGADCAVCRRPIQYGEPIRSFRSRTGRNRGAWLHGHADCVTEFTGDNSLGSRERERQSERERVAQEHAEQTARRAQQRAAKHARDEQRRLAAGLDPEAWKDAKLAAREARADAKIRYAVAYMHDHGPATWADLVASTPASLIRAIRAAVDQGALVEIESAPRVWLVSEPPR